MGRNASCSVNPYYGHFIAISVILSAGDNATVSELASKTITDYKSKSALVNTEHLVGSKMTLRSAACPRLPALGGHFWDTWLPLALHLVASTKHSIILWLSVVRCHTRRLVFTAANLLEQVKYNICW